MGERFLFLAERLPVISLWQAEAMTLDLLAAPESRQALDGLTLLSETLEGLLLHVDSLPTLLDDQRDAFLSAFDEREEGIRSLLDEAGIVMRDAGALTESGERLAALERAEGLAGTPRDVIDHAARRGAQLIVLLFVLLAAYRFGPALIGRRASSSS